MQQLNIDRIVFYLGIIARSPVWEGYTTTKLGCIFLARKGSSMIFSPLTAVYFGLTEKEIHHGTFWVKELTEKFGLSCWDALAFSYACTACDIGFRYDRQLRERILITLKLPSELK